MTAIADIKRRINFKRPNHNMKRIALEFAKIRPFGGARLIFADPPWKHEDWSDLGDKRKTAGHQYETQPIEWIKALPVDVLAAHDCLLFLWTTAPLFPRALDVIEAWGFKYSTSGSWIKRTVNGKLAFGGGRRLRSCHEPFILATRGRPPVSEAIRSVIKTSEATDDPFVHLEIIIDALRREHSRKPDAAFEAARRCVKGPAVELFSRESREGWITWGDQVGKFDNREAAE